MSRRTLVVGGAAAGGGVLGASLGALLPSRSAQSAEVPEIPGFLQASGRGIDPTGAEDSTRALQGLLDRAQESGGTLILPAGTYTVSTLETKESFTQPSIVGAGMRSTVLRGTGDGPVLAMTGGSGQLAGSRISDLTVSGTAATGIELRGSCGLTVERVRFDDLAVGLMFHNASPGSFTEFSVAHACIFDSSVDQPLEYRRTSGNESFHGSGFRDCVLVQHDGTTAPLIRIGAECLVYNAPWDGTLFASTATALVRNASERPVTSLGTLRFESAPGTSGCLVVDPESRSAVFHAGEAVFLSDGISAGDDLVFVNRARVNPDKSVSAARQPFAREVEVSGQPTGLVPLGGMAGGLVSVSVAGPSYAFNAVFQVFRHTDGGTVVALGTAPVEDGGGWGPPTFAVDGRWLTITNANYPGGGVRARAWIIPTGSPLDSPPV